MKTSSKMTGLFILATILFTTACGNLQTKDRPQAKTDTPKKIRDSIEKKDAAQLKKEKEAKLKELMMQGTAGNVENTPPTPEEIGQKLFQEAARHAKAKRFQQALDVLNQSIDAYAYNANVWFARGSIKWQTDDLQGALEDFSQCLNINPEHEKAAINSSQILIQQGRNQEAIDLLSTTLQKYSKTPMTYYNRGIAFSKMDKLQAALKDFDKAIELDPGYANAYNNRANVYYLLNKQDKACKDWKKSLELGNEMAQKAIDAYCE